MAGFVAINGDKSEAAPPRLYFRTQASGASAQWQVSLDDANWEALFEINQTGCYYVFNNRSSALGKLLALDDDGRIKMWRLDSND